MVLNDEETFTDLWGCMIVGVDDDFDDDELPGNCQVIQVFKETQLDAIRNAGWWKRHFGWQTRRQS